ncbi:MULTISPECIES: glycosyltransferase [unclassified Myroides]|uniref:glycosyltransferase n=1 Tax=unclassified Myroides TaxID=2642485 RepID=UPI0031011750
MKIKIVFIIPSLRRGGVERVTTNIINCLSLELYEIILIICKGTEKENEMFCLLQDGVNVIYLNKNNVREALPDIFGFIGKNEIDLIFTSFDHLSLPILVYKYLNRKKWKTIVRLNTLPSNKLISNWRSKVYTFFFKRVIKLSDFVISQSEEMKQDIMSCYGLSSDSIIAIRNIVDVNHVINSSLEKVKKDYFNRCLYTYIAAGSLGDVKGFDILIKAVDIVVKQGFLDSQVLIMGDNREKNEDYKSYLENLIKERNLQEFVKLIGFQSNPYSYISNADAFVLSSRKEGFPNVVLESLVLQKPCLVTNCVDFTNVIIEGVNGVVVPVEDPEELAKGLIKIRDIHNVPKNTFVNFDYNNWFKEVVS